MYVLLEFNGFAKFIERTYPQSELNKVGKSADQLNYKVRLENISVDKNTIYKICNIW